MTSSNHRIAAQLAEIATLLTVRKADRFRIRAYERAARTIATLPVDIASLGVDERARLHGIGSGLARLIEESLATGDMALLQELRAAEPIGFGQLVALRGIGQRLARTLATERGITTAEGLRAAIAAGELASLPGWTATKERVVLTALDAPALDDGRLLLAHALALADLWTAELAAVEGVVQVAVVGSLRRGRETLGGVDLAVATVNAPAVLDAVVALPLVVTAVARAADHVTVVAARGGLVRVHAADPQRWGTALVRLTGSVRHVRRLEAIGSLPEVAAEDDVYTALGLQPVPPVLREDDGEVECAAEGLLARPVTLGDLRGDLHGHSDWSKDGTQPLDVMAAAAGDAGLAYWAATDHTKDLFDNMDREQVLMRRATLDHLRQSSAVRILDGAELNIGVDGALDFDTEFLLGFEVCVASIHSRFDLPQADQTRRILIAMKDPAVTVIGHPTGRLVHVRRGYDIDIHAIAQGAAETGTALEVNGSARRLDLRDAMVRAAIKAGATLAISSDAHATGELANLRYGALTAARGWATPADVLNCRDVEGVLRFAAAKRR